MSDINLDKAEISVDIINTHLEDIHLHVDEQANESTADDNNIPNKQDTKEETPNARENTQNEDEGDEDD